MSLLSPKRVTHAGFTDSVEIYGFWEIGTRASLLGGSSKISKVFKGTVCHALIIETKSKYKKKDGSYLLLQENSAILIDKKGNPIGTRILGRLPKVLKKKKFIKFFSLSKGLT